MESSAILTASSSSNVHDLADLRRRTEWFEDNLGDGADDDLFGRFGFIASRESVLWQASSAVGSPVPRAGSVI
jgi:hypothetical protein